MCRSPAWRMRRGGYYALQFHPEVTHTTQGAKIYARFLHEICGCGESWRAGSIIEDAVARVRTQVGGAGVLLGLSGGVDSAVVAALLNKAIGKQLHCVFVDHGLLRHEEGDQLMEVFAEQLGVHVIRVNATAEFFAARCAAWRIPRSQAQDHRQDSSSTCSRPRPRN